MTDLPNLVILISYLFRDILFSLGESLSKSNDKYLNKYSMFLYFRSACSKQHANSFCELFKKIVRQHLCFKCDYWYIWINSCYLIYTVSSLYFGGFLVGFFANFFFNTPVFFEMFPFFSYSYFSCCWEVICWSTVDW